MPDVSLLRLLDDAVRDLPDGEALVVAGSRRTYAELAAAVRAARAPLVAAGVGAGTPVRLEVADPAAAVVALWALWSLGAALVVGDPGGVASGASVVRSPHRSARTPLSARTSVLARPLGASRAIARRVRRAVGAGTMGVVGHHVPPAVVALEVERPEGSTHALAAPPSPTDAALIVVEDPRTERAIDALDGPGGHAGATVLTHRALVAAAIQARLWVPDVRTGGERCLVAEVPGSPVLLVLGVLATVLSAGTLVVAEGGDLARTAARSGASLAAVTPQGLRRLAEARRVHLTALRVVLVDAGGGAPGERVPWPDAAALARASGGARVAGVTAAVGPLPTHAHPVYGHVDPEGMGLPLTSTGSSIVDPDGHALAAGTIGRLVVEGPQLEGPGRAPWPAVADARGAVRRVMEGATS